MRFIRDDIRVRDLDKRYKKVMRRYTSSFVSTNSGGYSWNMAQNAGVKAAAEGSPATEGSEP
jgi:hypothetical protein